MVVGEHMLRAPSLYLSPNPAKAPKRPSSDVEADFTTGQRKDPNSSQPGSHTPARCQEGKRGLCRGCSGQDWGLGPARVDD